ncbi:MAG: beta-ketoacyl-ACP synthase [Salinisphaera sp.]|nr:beta-ketoacyl-ACP synthase [Salinisphaera sp.]
MARVAVTGMAGISPIGETWAEIEAALRSGRSGVSYIEEWDQIQDLNTRLGGRAPAFSLPAHFTRKRTRTMGRVALMATLASERALENAGLLGDETVTSGRMGVAYGSSTGSTNALTDFAQMLLNHSTAGVSSTSYLRMMPHTTAVNIAVYFGLKGRVIPTSSACTSGSQGIGYAFETIRAGKQTLMLAGGAEELCPTIATVFDTLFAGSTRNNEPNRTPRPFDVDRDGLVVSEGAGTLVLEDLAHAQARGAPVLAEIVGYGTNCDGQHVTQPNMETMGIAMQLALEDAGLDPSAIGYVNGHGTGTDRGDIAESLVTEKLFGSAQPYSTLKGHTGHTLGACGALEAWATIQMLNGDWYAPTLNLENLDPRCGELDYLIGDGRTMSHEFAMSNNLAFGGINTSLIFRRWQ